MYDQWHRTGRGALRALIGATILIATPAAAATRGYTITSFDAIRVDAPVTVIVTTAITINMTVMQQTTGSIG